MASCTQIELLQQAYIDDELSDAERVILEEHLAGCDQCRLLLRAQQRTNAELFENLAPYRLSRDLTGPVLDHLPELDRARRVDMLETNRRLKHPDTLGDRLRRLVPLAAAVLLVILGAVIRDNWPAPQPSADAVGVVTAGEGHSIRVSEVEGEWDRAKVESFVTKGARYQTGDNGRLVLALAGRTEIRLNRGTTVTVHDGRKVTVEGGQAYFDVGATSELFRVFTPNGELTVYGTVFDVRVTAETSRVVLAEGSVAVRHGEFPGLQAVLKANQQIEMVRGVNSMSARSCNAAKLMAWADDLVHEQAAYDLFARRIESRQTVQKIPMGSDYLMSEPVNGRHLKGVQVSWVHDPHAWNYCGFDILVFDDKDELIFSGSIDPQAFIDSRNNTIELSNDRGYTPDTRIIRAEVKPNCPRGRGKQPELDIEFLMMPKGSR